MDQFDGTGRTIQRADILSQTQTGGIDQQRADMFAAGKGGIAHGLVQECRFTLGGGQPVLQGPLHASRTGGDQ